MTVVGACVYALSWFGAGRHLMFKSGLTGKYNSCEGGKSQLQSASVAFYASEPVTSIKPRLWPLARTISPATGARLALQPKPSRGRVVRNIQALESDIGELSATAADLVGLTPDATVRCQSFSQPRCCTSRRRRRRPISSYGKGCHSRAVWAGNVDDNAVGNGRRTPTNPVVASLETEQSQRLFSRLHQERGTCTWWIYWWRSLVVSAHKQGPFTHFPL